MTSTEASLLRDLPQPNLNNILKSNSYSAIKLLKTVGEFIHKVSVIKEQTGNQILSAVESFRRKGADMKKDRCALSSAFSSWETILGEYENEAHDMLKLSANLKQVSASVCEDAHRKKMLCKRLFGFRENFENIMDKADETLQKEHTRYSDACSKLTKSQNAEPGKFNQLVKRSGSFHSPKGSSIRLRPNTENEKTDKQEHLVALCRNSHNNYVLQLNTFNNMNDAFYKTALPQILDDLQEIQEQVTCSIVDTFQECAKIEKDKLLQNIKRLDNIESIVELVDAKTDIKIFVQGNHGENLEIPKRNFIKPEEALENLPDNKLHLDDVTEPALKRKYVAVHKKTKDIEVKIKKGEGTFRGVKTLRDSYISNPTYGNAAEMADDILRQKNELRTLQWWQNINQNQALVFADVLDRLGITEEDLEGEWSGDEESVTGSSTDSKRQSINSAGRGNKKSHQFVEHSYKRPTFCHYCKKVMKGFVKQGMRCELCRMNVHRKCKDNVQYCRGSYAARKGKLSHGDSLSDCDDASTPKHQRRPKSGVSSSSNPDLNPNGVDEDPEDYYDAPDNLLTSELHCVAMYDYSGDNDGDLKMSAGDKIRVLNSADENWWEGCCKGKTGFFPASYVQLIEKDDVILRCLYDFTGQEGDELTMEAEQIIILINNEDNGWMTGRNGSVDGAFPATYVEVIKDNGPD